MQGRIEDRDTWCTSQKIYGVQSRRIGAGDMVCMLPGIWHFHYLGLSPILYMTRGRKCVIGHGKFEGQVPVRYFSTTNPVRIVPFLSSV